MLRFLLTFYISPLNELVGMHHIHLPCSAASRNCLDNSTLNRDIVRKCGKANSTVGTVHKFENLRPDLLLPPVPIIRTLYTSLNRGDGGRYIRVL